MALIALLGMSLAVFAAAFSAPAGEDDDPETVTEDEIDTDDVADAEDPIDPGTASDPDMSPDPDTDPMSPPESEPDAAPEPGLPPGQAYVLTNGDTLTGTAGDDTFANDPDAGPFTDATASGGDGDDRIDITATQAFTTSQLFGEDGDDTISNSAAFADSSIDGGAGNDEITAQYAIATTLLGGEGDDIITLANGNPGDPILIDGGQGNDTINGPGELGDDNETVLGTNGTILGGEGDDLISVNGQQFSGTGYVLFADGGAGEDTIRIDVSAITDQIRQTVGGNGALGHIRGGAGADTFDLTIHEGSSEDDDVFNPGADRQDTDGAWRLDAVRLDDFTPGEDVLMIDATPSDPAYALASARLEQPDEDTSLIVLRYESDTLDPRDVLIDLNGAAVTWDDVRFVNTGVELASG